MAGLLRETIRREGLQGRVRMLGAVPSDQVRDVLVRGPPQGLGCVGQGSWVAAAPVRLSAHSGLGTM